MIFRKVLTILSLHFICLLILVLALGFLSAFLDYRARDLKQIAAQKEEQLQSARFQSFKTDIALLNNTLEKLQDFSQKQILFSVFLGKFLPLVPSDLGLKVLSFRLSSKAPSKEVFADIRLDGMIGSRENLYEFKKLLERQSDFQDIYFSPSSWSKARYPEFSLNLSFIPSNKQ